MARAETETGIKYQFTVFRSSNEDLRECQNDKLCIKFNIFRLIKSRLPNRAYHHNSTLRRQKDKYFSLSKFKHQILSSDPRTDTRETRKKIVCCLKSLCSPDFQRLRKAVIHKAVIYKILKVVELAETADFPVVVNVWECNRIVKPYRGPLVVGSEVTPAATSAIDGLKLSHFVQVDDHGRLDRCSICLEDFDVLDQSTELPCGHHFHMHCICQSLEISHMCPLCRYPMPTNEDDSIIRWEPPPIEFVKINFGGSVKSNPLGINVAAGFVIRNSEGVPILCAAVNIGESTVTFAEAVSLREGLLAAKGKGFGNLIIEGDSLVVINIITRAFDTPSYLLEIMEDIRKLAADFHTIIFKRAFPEANFVAYTMANVGHKLVSKCSWDSSFPVVVKKALLFDSNGVGCSRGFCL